MIMDWSLLYRMFTEALSITAKDQKSRVNVLKKSKLHNSWAMEYFAIYEKNEADLWVLNTADQYHIPGTFLRSSLCMFILASQTSWSRYPSLADEETKAQKG